MCSAIERRQMEADLLCFFTAKGFIFVLCGAFIDESGTHQGSAVTCLAAYVFDREQYGRFIDEWSAALGNHDLKYFHAVDYAHGRGEFQRTGLPRDKSDALYSYLIRLIIRRARLGIMVSASEQDWFSARPPESQDTLYVKCIQYCLGGIFDWAKKYDFDGGISYFFEQGHANQFQANTAMNLVASVPVFRQRSRYVSHTFGNKPNFCGLQAADILAYEWFKDRCNDIEGRPRKRRRSLQALMAGKLHVYAHFSLDDMRNDFENYPLLREAVLSGDVDLGLRITATKEKR